MSEKEILCLEDKCFGAPVVVAALYRYRLLLCVIWASRAA
jgi:hypothetical protein